MTLERVIQLLQVEKDYTLKQTGHSQQPINKEVAEALDIAIEVIKGKIDIVRCEKCAFAQKQVEFKNLYVCLQNERFVKKNDYCSYGERRTDNA